MGLCVLVTHLLRDDWDNIHTLSYYHHQIGSMNYYPLFRVRSWNNGMRCMSFYILTEEAAIRNVGKKPFCSTGTADQFEYLDIITYVVPFCKRWSPDSYLGCRWDKRLSNVIESKVHVMWLAMLCQIIKTVFKMYVMHRNLINVVSQVSIRIVRFNTSKPRQNGRHFVDDIIKFIFLNENIWILIKFSLKFVP